MNKPLKSHRTPKNKCLFCGKLLAVTPINYGLVSIHRNNSETPQAIACHPFCELPDFV